MLKILEQRFASISAIDALTILCQIFCVPNAYVYTGVNKFPLHELYDNSEVYMGSLAKDIEIRHYGGPPHQGCWYDGTLLTMLLDHALYLIAKKKMVKVNEALRYNHQPT